MVRASLLLFLGACGAPHPSRPRRAPMGRFPGLLPFVCAHRVIPPRPSGGLTAGSSAATARHYRPVRNRRPNRWRQFPGICRPGPRSQTRRRRHCRPRLSRQPQRRGRQGNHCRSRRLAAVPAPYRSDLNPIERMFSKLKTPLHKAAERTVVPSGAKSLKSSITSRLKNAPTLSDMLAMIIPDRKLVLS